MLAKSRIPKTYRYGDLEAEGIKESLPRARRPAWFPHLVERHSPAKRGESDLHYNLSKPSLTRFLEAYASLAS